MAIKLLFATPYGDITGGINQWAKHIIGYHSTILSDIDIEVLPMNTARSKDKSIIGSPLRRIWLGIRTYSAVIADLRRRISDRHYDILHITTSASLSLFKDICMMHIARRRGISTVLHFHFGRIPQLRKRGGWEWRMIKRAIALSTTSIVIDKASYDTLLDEGIENVALLANPLSRSVEELIANHQDVERKPRHIVFVGHGVRTKGVYELVRSCSRIEGVHLSLIGPIAPAVRTELATLGGEWLEIEGAQPYERVIEKLLSCSCFVLPTYTEGFPNVIIESMACSCSIVTTPVGAIPEMLDIDGSKPCGICVDVGDDKALEDAIRTMLDNRDVAEEYGRRARARVLDEYMIDKVWDRLNNIWHKSVKPKRN